MNMNRKRQISKLIEMLDGLDFYKFMPQKRQEEAKLITLETASLYQIGNERVYSIDAEIIREKGVNEYIEEISPFLGKIGAQITQFSEKLNQGFNYTIKINGEHFDIWSKKDDQIYDDPWFAPTIRFFNAINNILEKNKCEERLYYDCVANDTTIVFLTNELFAVISEYCYILKDSKLRIPHLRNTK